MDLISTLKDADKLRAKDHHEEARSLLKSKMISAPFGSFAFLITFA